MRASEFGEWMARHCKVMGITFQNDLAAVSGWCHDFAGNQVTFAEAQAATTAMLNGARRVKFTEQLGWMLNYITRQRSAQSSRVASKAIEPCPNCLDLGRIESDDGADYCDCDRGQAMKLLHAGMRRRGMNPDLSRRRLQKAHS